MDRTSTPEPPAWVEIDLRQFRRNWDAITRYRPHEVGIAYVVKDDAYGHGAVPLARRLEKAGGIRESLRIIDVARACGLKVMIGSSSWGRRPSCALLLRVRLGLAGLLMGVVPGALPGGGDGASVPQERDPPVPERRQIPHRLGHRRGVVRPHGRQSAGERGVPDRHHRQAADRVERLRSDRRVRQAGRGRRRTM